MNKPLRDYNNRRRYFEYRDKRLTQHEKMVERELVKYLNEQKERILERMPQELSKGLAEQVFNRDEERRLAKKALFPALREVMGEEAAEVGGRFGVEIGVTAEMEAWLDNRADVFSRQINDTTFEQLKTEITEGRDAGESYDQIANRIDGKIDEISEGRAGVIARTETHSAQQKATIEGYKEAGVETKIWVAVMDNETRDTHAMVDGDEIPFDRHFDNGLKYPGDPAGGPEEIINCRCQI